MPGNLARFFQSLRMSGQKIAACDNTDHVPGIVIGDNDQATNICFDHVVGGFTCRMAFLHS